MSGFSPSGLAPTRGDSKYHFYRQVMAYLPPVLATTQLLVISTGSILPDGDESFGKPFL
jgi:hypothetical protein